jgi:cysteine-rich repeat protein
VGDSCNGGVCVSGNGTDCKDDNLCTVDGCNPATGVCFFSAESAAGLPCDADGNVCTVGDACQNGACFPGGPLDCDDGNACTTDSCNPDGGCKHTPNAAPCDDGDACTGPDACQGGVCDGPAVDCDDINPCTIDSCIPATGCKGTAVPDKTACGPVDLCFSGACVPATCGDGVITVAIGEECDDGNTVPGDGCRANCTKEDTACADGDRDGTMTASEYPKIAACSGPWQGHIASLSPAALCGAEFHVCNSSDVALLKTIKQKDAFQTGCWAVNAANDFGGCGPCSNGPNSNDMAGVGKNCQGKITNYGSSCISDNYRIDSANQTCVRPWSGAFSWINGVMCCANDS